MNTAVSSNWLGAIRRWVDRDVRDRGDAYFRGGAVETIEGDAIHVRASVNGSELYDVSVRFDHESVSLRGDCTCEYVAEYDAPCKHIWATLLAANARGLMGAARNQQGLTLALDEESTDASEDLVRLPEIRTLPMSPPKPSDRRGGNRGEELKGGGGSSWQRRLEEMARVASAIEEEYPAGKITPEAASPESRIVYLIEPLSGSGEGLGVVAAKQTRKKNGEWSKIKSRNQYGETPFDEPDAQDRELLASFEAMESRYATRFHRYGVPSVLPLNRTADYLARICATGRALLVEPEEDERMIPLRFDDGPPWRYEMTVEREPASGDYVFAGRFRRDNDEPLPARYLVTVCDTIIFPQIGLAARYASLARSEWVVYFAKHGPMRVAAKDAGRFRATLALSGVPVDVMPTELRVETRVAECVPVFVVKKEERRERKQRQEFFVGRVRFDYPGRRFHSGDKDGLWFDEKADTVYRRDKAREMALMRQVRARGRHFYLWQWDRADAVLTREEFDLLANELMRAGWLFEGEQPSSRMGTLGEFKLTSGIDWFDLTANATFGDEIVPLPKLLEAIGRGQQWVALSGGRTGFFDQDALRRLRALVGADGTASGDALRFRRPQAALLDALLDAQPRVTFDETFVSLRKKLRSFDGVKPADAPEGFVGELRPYQREGLGWLHALRELGFGGCLADDMGLGKTVQVLAMLEDRAKLRRELAPGDPNRPPPSIVVVPRSLVFNWKLEASRFTPALRVLDHSGVERLARGAKPEEIASKLDERDVVLTTYGTLKRDIAVLNDVRFDYAIADEANAAKNASTDTAKSIRLLRADHRLAMTGTPIENRLGDLWSLFDFVNPGMLGRSSSFKAGAGAKDSESEFRRAVARAVRPFIIRRTKDAVAKDLPAKTEQTLFCDLGADQRKLYNELRDHYRQSLLGLLDAQGMAKSKIQVLEALLRLRQAACHPALIDKKSTDCSSAKLDTLVPQLAEVVEEGHKALVFSQFTSFLSLVKEQLGKAGVVHEYLDGQTTDRQARVERFQTDPACKVFLISLKAGGVGLNLTAAEYVFLLDPWWNPAVEAQAIDRTHRIGQTRSVFAYRLIAKDTVEEKVLELQQSKRELAEAILNADGGVIGRLTREDLEMLLR